MAKTYSEKSPPWTKNWIDKMWQFTFQNFVDPVTNKIDFEALGKEEFFFRKALWTKKLELNERAKTVYNDAEKLYNTRVKSGSSGGRPKASKATRPKNFDEVVDFCKEHSVDIADARQIWDMTVERDWHDADGNDVVNFWGYLITCSKTIKEKREKEQRK